MTRHVYVGMKRLPCADPACCPDLDPQDYCGCCGGPCGPDRFWCVRCTRTVGHLGPADRHAWDRTYQATHGKPCPFA